MKFKRLVASKNAYEFSTTSCSIRNENEAREYIKIGKENGVNVRYDIGGSWDSTCYLSSSNFDSFLKIIDEFFDFKNSGYYPDEIGLTAEDLNDWKELAEKQGIDFDTFNNKLKNTFNYDYNEAMKEING